MLDETERYMLLLGGDNMQKKYLRVLCLGLAVVVLLSLSVVADEASLLDESENKEELEEELEEIIDENNLTPEQNQMINDWLSLIRTKNNTLNAKEIEEIGINLQLALRQCRELEADQYQAVLVKIGELIENQPAEKINNYSFQNLSRAMLRLRILAKQRDMNFIEELTNEIDSGSLFTGEKQNPGLALGHYKNLKKEKQQVDKTNNCCEENKNNKKIDENKGQERKNME